MQTAKSFAKQRDVLGILALATILAFATMMTLPVLAQSAAITTPLTPAPIAAPTANAPTVSVPVANAPVANAPVANAPTVNAPMANGPTVPGVNANSSVAELAQTMAPPLSQVLGLSDWQVLKLEEFYSRYASQRLEQESKAGIWQAEYQRLMGSPTGDRKRAGVLWGALSKAQQKITGSLVANREAAWKVLSEPQRGALPSLVSSQVSSQVSGPGQEPFGTRRVREDAYFQLLLLPMERVLATPLDEQFVRRLATSARYNNSSRQRSYGYGVGGFGFPGHWDLGYHGWGFGDHYGRHNGGHGGIFGGHSRRSHHSRHHGGHH